MIRSLHEKHFKSFWFGVGVAVGLVLLWAHQTGAIQVTTPELPIQPGEVTSGMILDGTIINADVSSTAAIAATKIATTTANYWITAGAQTLSGVKTFGSFPLLPGGTPTGNEPVGRTYLDTRVTAGITVYAALNIAKGQAVYRSYDASQTKTPTGNFGFRGSTQTVNQGQQAAQSFSLVNTSTISSITLNLCKQSSPTGNVFISIQGNSATSSPNATDIVSSTTSGSALQACDGRNESTYNFNTTSSFNASTTYWIVFNASDALNDTNFYGMGSNATDVYTRGKTAFFNGTDWTSSVPTAKDAWFDLNLSHTAVELASGAASTTADGFLGFADAAINALNSGTINFSGLSQVTSSERIVVGGLYYLSGTAGSVASSAATFSKKVGIGVASSTLLIIETF